MQQQPLREVQLNTPQQLNTPLQQHIKPSSIPKPAMQQASTQDLLPVFDLTDLLQLADGQQPSAALLLQCQRLAECLEKTGCLVVRAILELPTRFCCFTSHKKINYRVPTADAACPSLLTRVVSTRRAARTHCDRCVTRVCLRPTTTTSWTLWNPTLDRVRS